MLGYNIKPETKGIVVKNKIKQTLKEKGLKANWLAGQIGCHESEISQWIAGRRVPSLERAIILAGLLNCSVEALFPSMLRKEK